MKPPRLLRLRPRDEGGATLAIVAIVLIALIGMIVLVVDVGGLLWKRRELVNGSDAAALAAAKTCAVSIGTDPQDMQVVADTWAMQNVRNLEASHGGVIADTCRAPSGYVTVEYSQPMQLFFAPVLGFGANNNVTTRATAIWGPPRFANPVPLAVYTSALQGDCDINETGEFVVGRECYMWFDNDFFDNSAFGFLDLRPQDSLPGNQQGGWDTTRNSGCSAPGSNNLGDWAGGSGVADLSVNYPDPTFVCRVSGVSDSVWQVLESRVTNPPQTLTFPINRCYDVVPAGTTNGQVNRNGQPVPCSTAPHKYDIVGFVAFELTGIYRPNQAGGTSGTCIADRPMIAGSTFNLDFIGFNNSPACFTVAPDSISGVTVQKVQNNQPGPRPVQCAATPTAGCDWIYVTATRQLSWNASGPAAESQNYRIAFSWQNEGPCGVPPNNNSGNCMTVRTVDVQIGGIGTGPGVPSNLRAVLLCNPEVAGSCAPVQVP